MNTTRRRAWRKLREWFIRYLPAEIAGTITAIASFWLAYKLTDSLVVAAIAGTAGENVGYYGVAASNEIVKYWRKHAHHPRLRRSWLTGVRTLRNMLVEFGPAEAVDSLAVRPGLFYLLPTIFSGNMGLALIAAKLLADVVFYSFAITGYELRKRYIGDDTTSKTHSS